MSKSQLELAKHRQSERNRQTERVERLELFGQVVDLFRAKGVVRGSIFLEKFDPFPTELELGPLPAQSPARGEAPAGAGAELGAQDEKPGPDGLTPSEAELLYASSPAGR
jgi:hypothetical protein